MVGTVVMTVSALPNRPSYLYRTLESWSKVRSLEEWLFRFHVEPGPLQAVCVAMITAWRNNSGLSDVEIVCNEQRLGVLRNPWAAFDSSFRNGTGFVVLVEEDIIVSTDVLEFFLRTSVNYSSRSEVLAVCGSYFGELGDPSETYLAQDFCPLVWGTWRNRWNDVLRDTWDLDYSSGNSDGSEAGWDWNIKKRLLPQRNMVCVFPRVSRALHIGEYGAHMQPRDFKDSQSPAFVSDL